MAVNARKALAVAVELIRDFGLSSSIASLF
jgi:hypothetical protein